MENFSYSSADLSTAFEDIAERRLFVSICEQVILNNPNGKALYEFLSSYDSVTFEKFKKGFTPARKTGEPKTEAGETQITWGTFEQWRSKGSKEVTVQRTFFWRAHVTGSVTPRDLLLEFIKHCEDHPKGRIVLKLNTGEDHATWDTLAEKIKTSQETKSSTLITSTLDEGVKIANSPQKNLRTKTERYPTVTSQGEWLNPRNKLFIPFVGREDEIGLLDAFAKGDPDNELAFKLWAIVGPSGAGKTRLLTHWANRDIYNDWEAIDVNSKTDLVWSNWLPQMPTMISIDYIYGYDKVIADIIARAENVDFEFPVRLLLLDHAMPDTMVELLESPRWVSDGGRVQDLAPMAEKIFYDDAPLKLQIQEKDDSNLLEQIICLVAYKEGDNPLEKINDPVVQRGVQYLKKTVGARQPLFAALVGDAIRQGNIRDEQNEDYITLNRFALMKNYLKSRDRLTWKLKGNRELGAWAACFIAAATAIATESKGVCFETLREAVPNNQKPVIDQNYDRLAALCNAVVSGDDQYILKSFRPDILGETHFLLVLKETLKGCLQDFKKALPVLVTVESDNVMDGRINEFIAFITRLARNLSNDDQSSKDTRLFWEVIELFLGSGSFIEDKTFKWAASMACFEIYLILNEKEEGFTEQAEKFLNQVGADALYRPPEEIMGARHVWMAIKYFGLNEKQGEPIPESLIDLLNHWDSDSSRDNTALMLSISADSTTVSHYLIEQDANLESKSKEDTMARMFARGKGLEDVTFGMVEKDLNLNAQNNKYKTALVLTQGKGLQDVAFALVKKKPYLAAQNSKGMTALMIACAMGLENVALALVEKDVNLEAKNKDDMTALMIACASGMETVALALVEKDANLGAQNKEKATALMLACVIGMETVALALVEKGVNLDARNYTNSTALMVACESGMEMVALALVEKDANLGVQNNKEKVTALMIACVIGMETVALALVEKDANLDAKNKDDLTALMFACESGLEAVALALVEKGANLGVQNNNEGMTALMLACGERLDNVALALVEKDANLDALDKKNWTALIFACASGMETVALALVERDVNLDAKNKDDWTALMYACHNGLENVALALLDKGAYINCKDNSGHTALMSACVSNLKNVVGILLDKNVNTDELLVLGETRVTALGLARGFKNLEIVEMLEEAGALEIPVHEEKL